MAYASRATKLRTEALWRERNRAKIQAYAKEWRAKNEAAVRDSGRVRMAEWRKVNRARELARLRANRAANPERERAAKQRFYKAHAEEMRAKRRQWCKENPAACAASSSMRRARLAQAAPPWLTELQRRQMEKMYQTAFERGMQVDHIVPLRGKNVCGLHVPWNLQHLPKVENCRKGNRMAA